MCLCNLTSFLTKCITALQVLSDFRKSLCGNRGKRRHDQRPCRLHPRHCQVSTSFHFHPAVSCEMLLHQSSFLHFFPNSNLCAVIPQLQAERALCQHVRLFGCHQDQPGQSSGQMKRHQKAHMPVVEPNPLCRCSVSFYSLPVLAFLPL